MTIKPKLKNTWVQDLNKSIDNVKLKKKKQKYILYFGLFTVFLTLFAVLFILSKSKLYLVNPKFNLTKIDKIKTNSMDEKINENDLDSLKIVNKPNKNLKKEVKVKSIKNKIDNHSKLLNTKNYKVESHSNEKNGKYITYYDNGNKWVELNFKNGLRDGLQYTWHRNGQLKSELNYILGQKHGIQKWWQKDGKILNEKNYINGKWPNK